MPVKEFWKFPIRPAFIKPNPPLNSNFAWDGTWTTLNPTFTVNKLKQIVPIIDDALHEFLANIENDTRLSFIKFWWGNNIVKLRFCYNILSVESKSVFRSFSKSP